MRSDLAPKYVQSIGQSKLLWFERSNTYAVLSQNTYVILNLLLQSDFETEFHQKTLLNTSLNQQQSQDLFIELNAFLENSNVGSNTIATNKNEGIFIPSAFKSYFYDFGNRTIQINYDSSVMQQLFHPQLAHHLNTKLQTADVTFDIFKIDNSLYIYKNQHFIYSCLKEEYYLLQGKFALELTNEIHEKSISNWLSTFHASTICNSKEAIMLIGDSGNGKSTLSALMMAAGFDLLSDDLTPFYSDDLCLYRYPAAISLKKGAFDIMTSSLKSFDSLPTYFSGPKKIDLKYAPPISNFQNSRKQFPCNKIVYVKYTKDCESTFCKVSEEKILNTLIPDAWISPKPRHAKQFLNWLRTVEFYELQYSDTHFAKQSLSNMFTSCD